MAHWPGYGSPFYHDLRRTAAYAPVLGKFVTVDEYFRDTSPPGVYSKFMPDQYRTPYLLQTGNNPISVPAEILVQQANTDAGGVVKSLTEFAVGKTLANSDGMTQSSNDAVCAAFAGSLPRASDPVQSQYLLMNPLGFVRQVGVDLSKFLPASAGTGAGCRRSAAIWFHILHRRRSRRQQAKR